MDEPLNSDTIAAISTALGPGAIGIVRLSGPEALAVAQRVFRPARGRSVGSHETFCLLYGHVIDPEDGKVVDEALLAVMRAPRSYTREDVVEFHCHGGLAAQRAVLRLVLRVGARLAEPGEFTRRAFLNGRIDLAQAESVAAIVAAKSSVALRASVRQLEGGLSQRLRALRRVLLGVLARIEATIDFSDEDVEPIEWAEITAELEHAQKGLEQLVDTAFLGRVLEQGLRTAIVGRPNVGKSSLLNALLMRERAIVSDIPGTTRDTVEELVEIGGVPVHLVDTAGIRQGGDHVEQLGVARSVKAMEQADLVLAVVDLAAPWNDEDTSLVKSLDPRRTIVVGNKIDLVRGRAEAVEASMRQKVTEVTGALGGCGGRTGVAEGHGGRDVLGEGNTSTRRATGTSEKEKDVVRGAEVTSEWQVCAVSARTGERLERLRALLQEMATGGAGFHLEEPVLATERQRRLASEACAGVVAALEAARAGAGEELVCEEIRGAVQALGRITGEELTPDLLDEIFSRFCLGK